MDNTDNGKQAVLIVDPDLAARIGLNEAIVLKQLLWLQDHHSSRSFHDCKWWLAMSHAELTEQFPFWAERTLQRHLKALEDAGILQVRNGIGRTQNEYYVEPETIDRIKAEPLSRQIVTTRKERREAQSARTPKATVPCGDNLSRQSVTTSPRSGDKVSPQGDRSGDKVSPQGEAHLDLRDLDPKRDTQRDARPRDLATFSPPTTANGRHWSDRTERRLDTSLVPVLIEVCQLMPVTISAVERVELDEASDVLRQANATEEEVRAFAVWFREVEWTAKGTPLVKHIPPRWGKFTAYQASRPKPRPKPIRPEETPEQRRRRLEEDHQRSAAELARVQAQIAGNPRLKQIHDDAKAGRSP